MLRMVQKISLLPELVINQIAAGEVLEHPASAVKELIENALDAGATRIAIDIIGGGQQLIRIEDNGCGMSASDAMVCLQRHATSKIRETDDLLRLVTLGFRGEALAAIGSVSRLEMQTADGAESTRVVADGGKILTVEPCARNQGTTIDIRSLFYNVPARLKFQKSPRASSSQILKMVQTIALGYTEVSFTLRSDNQVVFQREGESEWQSRAREILGPLSHLVEAKIDTYRVEGLIGSPEEARGNRSCQYTFVNRRPVFSPLIARAVKDGYSTRIGESQYPAFLLFLDLPPEEFDINVHPQKRDIRFQNEGKIYRLIERGIRAAFEQNISNASIDEVMPRLDWSHLIGRERTYSMPFIKPKESAPAREPLPWSLQEEIQPSFIPPSRYRRAVAVVGSFLLLEGEGFYLLDLKGAEARILFEERGVKGEPLCEPIEIELGSEEGTKWALELQEIGVEARFLGGRFLAVDALPYGVEPVDLPDLLERFKADRKAASALCRFCRGRKKRYSLEEASLIEKKLGQCSDSLYDPLGRVIERKMEEEDLARLLEMK